MLVEHRNCSLSYSLRGEGTPVVLIQGVGVHGEGWLSQVEGLSGAGCRCLTFDNRGIGRSQAIAGAADGPYGAPISVAQMTQDTLAVMDAADIPAAHLVGHSLGGLVAIHLALTARPRVRSLTLMCTFANGASALKMTGRMFWLGLRSRVGTRCMRRQAFLEIVMPGAYLKTVDRTALAERLAVFFGHDLGVQPPVVGAQLKALQAYDATPGLAELGGMPTLVISAADDPIARPVDAGRLLARGIPGARYVEYADASHGLPLQFPERVNALLLEHLASGQRHGSG